MNENKLQWLAIGCTVIGLLASVYFSAETLKATRMQSEIASHLHFTERYHKLLFNLIHDDSDVFKKTEELTKAHKYTMYELFELFATIKSLEDHYKEIDEEIWPHWERRIAFLFSKPAVRHAWQSHLQYADEIYPPYYTEYIDTVIHQQKLIAR